MLSCNCLNIIIESESGDFLKVTDYDEYRLTNEEQCENFFKLEHYKCTKAPNITTRQVLMQDQRRIGDWTVYQCINCGIATHAINTYKGPLWSLFPTYLLTYQKIKELQTSKNYSKCFNIILPEKIDKTKLKDVDPSTIADLKSHEGNFVEQFHQFKDRERQACQERINRYIEDQHSIVDDLVEIEEHFLEAMKWKFLEAKKKNIQTSNPQPTEENKNDNWKEAKIVSQASVFAPIVNSRREDEVPEEVFHMEDMDGIDCSPQHLHPLCEDDFELGNEEISIEGNGIRIQRQRTDPASIAKSLPISIPSFLSTHRNRSDEDSDDLEQEQGTVDIAASIKALARSVHGEAVFGELPRPRFSSQM